MEQKRKVTKLVLYVFLIGLSLFMLVPFYWMVISSLKLNKDVFSEYSETDSVYDSDSALYQLFCSLWFYKMSFQRERSDLSDVCNNDCCAVAGIYGAAVYPGVKDGLE